MNHEENNLLLVKRLIQRVDMRNPDPGPGRYTSLAWAAVLGHEETFEFLLNEGHDEFEDNDCVIYFERRLRQHYVKRRLDDLDSADEEGTHRPLEERE